jgi:hypothetical protein
MSFGTINVHIWQSDAHQGSSSSCIGSDLTEPAYGPIEFELRDLQMVGASLADRNGDGAQPAEQVVSADQQKL